MGDGAVIFITDSIEAGNGNSASVVRNMPGGIGGLAPGSESPYGLWGALGTRASKETIEEQLNRSNPPDRVFDSDRGGLLCQRQRRPFFFCFRLDNPIKPRPARRDYSVGRLALGGLAAAREARFRTSALVTASSGARAVGFGFDHLRQPTLVTRGAKRDIDRQLAQERDLQLLGLGSGPAPPKDVVRLAAIGAEKAAHVLDHAEHRNVDLAKHADRLDRVQQRHFLRRADDDGTGKRQRLGRASARHRPCPGACR